MLSKKPFDIPSVRYKAPIILPNIQPLYPRAAAFAYNENFVNPKIHIKTSGFIADAAKLTTTSMRLSGGFTDIIGETRFAHNLSETRHTAALPRHTPARKSIPDKINSFIADCFTKYHPGYIICHGGQVYD